MTTLRGDRLRGDPVFPTLKEAVIGLTGLAYWRDKDEMLADLLAGVLERRREPAAALLQRLQVELGRGPASEAVVDAVTIGETFFFRYQAQFDALEQMIIPDVMARNQSRRSLALWSAGCSNGAEAYSLSMLLRRRFATPLAGWRLDILGTDISIAALAEAHAGEYGAWTIRDLPEDLRQDCFVVHDRRWRIKARFRHDVRFARHNLVSQPPPDDGFDVVLCRNVLMYFDVPTRLRVLRHLSDAVVPGGWLLVGHAEVGPPVSDFFRAVVLPDCTLYQRPPAAAGAWG